VFHILGEKSVVKGEEFLFRVTMLGDEHVAVRPDFQKGEALGELDNHVFKVAPLHKLRPKGDLGTGFEDAATGAGHVKIGHAAYAGGQEVKIQCGALGHSSKIPLQSLFIKGEVLPLFGEEGRGEI
jgi:hypothetical protein